MILVHLLCRYSYFFVLCMCVSAGSCVHAMPVLCTQPFNCMVVWLVKLLLLFTGETVLVLTDVSHLD